MNRWLMRATLLLSSAGLLLAPALKALGCPFCGGVQMTLSDEIKAADVVVVARLIARAQPPTTDVDKSDPNPSDPDKSVKPVTAPIKSRFEIVEVLKGQDDLAAATEGKSQELETLYFGQEPPERSFMIQAVKGPDLAWGTPLPLSEAAIEYVRQLPALPENGPDRLKFFVPYLENVDSILARDAYDEFAKAPYDVVKAVKEYLDHDKLVAWINNADTTTSHRRLYLTLLGVTEREAPRPEDLAMLEAMMTADADEPKPALDALIACYLTLKGPTGLPLVEEEFLKDKDCPYSDTYAAIMALRFHGNEEEIIPKDQLLAGLRHLLDRPELADLVIPDLARWEDWSSMDRLVTLFKEADDKSSWVRVPVIQYLRACPLPEAAATIDELALIDPQAVKRASFFVPLGATAGKKPTPEAAATAKDKATGDAAAGDKPAAAEGAKSTPAAEKPLTKKQPAAAEKQPADAPAKSTQKRKSKSKAEASAAGTSEPAKPAPGGGK